MKRKLLISFSGGETSAFMAWWLVTYAKDQYDEILTVFANTGEEAEETLEFVEAVDKAFGLGVVWLEGVTHPGKRKGNTHRVVDYATASRQGEPFEEMIQKYGIPNKSYPHCTRELKENPIRAYLRSIGWEKGGHDTAIGIRIDEVDRMSPKAKANRLIYPLISDVPMTKPNINWWWDQQPFRLRLAGYEGNCKACWKQTLRKHLTLIDLHPEWYDFPERMEQQYGLAGHNEDGTPRVFFREGRSTADLRALARQPFNMVEDDHLVLDVSDGCEESCEVTFEHD